MIPLLLLVVFLAAGAKSKPKKLTPDGGRGLPPKPVNAELRTAACALIREGVTVPLLLPLLLRELHPAVSWPVAEEWSADDVQALPDEDRTLHDAAKRGLTSVLKDNEFLKACTEDASWYATGKIQRAKKLYQASWEYDERVEGDRGSTLPFDDFDTARAALLMGLWWFGAPAADEDRFVSAAVNPGTANRLSIWEMPGGGYRVVRIRGDATDVYQVGTLEEAQAQRETL